MQEYRFLLDIALILLCTKGFGLITRKFQMPQVVGALLGGLLTATSVSISVETLIEDGF